jgi:hypothetical protein
MFFDLNARFIWMCNVPAAIPSISFSSGVDMRPTTSVVMSVVISVVMGIGLQRSGFGWHIRRARY